MSLNRIYATLDVENGMKIGAEVRNQPQLAGKADSLVKTRGGAKEASRIEGAGGGRL